MTAFKYSGLIQASKSLLNRALIIQSYFPNIKIIGDSNCDDVLNMKKALNSYLQNQPIDCGDAGTVLRFFALRASRNPGVWTLLGSERLFSRPNGELIHILKQLGVEAQLSSNSLKIRSQGWINPQRPIFVDQKISSQFASSLILNAWNLNFPLSIEFSSEFVSQGYLDLTIDLARHVGMEIQIDDRFISINENQLAKKYELKIETDMSSAFAVAAAAALNGDLKIINFEHNSQQPDFIFIEILKTMGVELSLESNQLHVKKTIPLQPIDINLTSSPDLFPVLAVLASFANGVSRLHGAPHLQFKESNRILKTAELLQKMGVEHKTFAGGLEIVGKNSRSIGNHILFDPDNDHRMAMAAGLFKLMEMPIEIKNMDVVNKSFPEFWQIIGLN